MLKELILILMGGVLVNNYVLQQFLGICPFLGVSKKTNQAAGMGIGFLVALVLMAALREVIGNATFAGIEIPFLVNYKIPILTKAPGGFLVYGIVIAVMNKLTEKKGGVKRKSFSCEGCPSAGHCDKASCGAAAAAVADGKEEGENA